MYVRDPFRNNIRWYDYSRLRLIKAILVLIVSVIHCRLLVSLHVIVSAVDVGVEVSNPSRYKCDEQNIRNDQPDQSLSPFITDDSVIERAIQPGQC